MDTALVSQGLVDGCHARGPSGLALFARDVERVHLHVGVCRLGFRVDLIGEAAEAPGVDARHVDVCIAVHDPLGEVLATARSLRDSDGGAAAHPEVAQAARWPEQGVVVGRVGDGAVGDRFDADVLPHRNTLHHRFEVREHAVVVGLEELAVRVPVRHAAPVAPGSDGGCGFVDADQGGGLFLAVVARGRGIAHDRHLGGAADELVDRLRDEVLVLGIPDRSLGAHHLGHATRETARRIDDVLGHDRALLGGDLPLTAFAQRDALHAVPLHDRGAQIGGRAGHRVAGAGGVDVAVVQGACAGNDAGGVDVGVDAPDLVRPDDFHPHANMLGDVRHVLEPLELGLHGRESDAAAAVPAGVLTGHLLELRVE